jgi:hypothetical protein
MRGRFCPILATAFLCLRTLGLPSLSATVIPDEVKKIVTFIYAPLPSVPGANSLVPVGTGFFVAVRNTADARGIFGYLVTAKHVLQDRSGSQYPEIFLRLNRHKGDAELVRLELTGKDKKVFYHPTDNSVDIAVIPVLPPEATYDFKALPDELLTTEGSFKELGISEGAEVFFTGLFLPHVGQHKNYPIVRFGRVAMITDERISWQELGRPPEMLRLYLIETQSYGGNSGSPVFFYFLPPNTLAGTPILRLAGIMKGSLDELRPIGVIQSTQQAVSAQNLGIAVVTPSYLLYEILFSDELKTIRSKVK